MSSPPPTAIVVGAGIGGLTAAAALRRTGYQVRIFERATDLLPTGSALALTCNASVALRQMGIELNLDGRAVQWDRLHFKSAAGQVIRTIHYRHFIQEFGVPMLAVHRADLQQALLEQVGEESVTLGATATGYDIDGDQVQVTFSDGHTVRGDVLIGADGIRSAIRRQLLGPEELRDGDYICWLATPHFTHTRVTPGYAAHYWGRGRRFGLADIGNGRVYWWGTMNMPGEAARTWKGDREEIERTYAGWADEVGAVLRATPEDTIITIPAQDRPFRGSWGTGPVTLLGDAAHPMMTSLGQGAAMAVEDGVVLAQCLAGADTISAGLRAYEDARRPRTHQMVQASYALSRIEQAEHPLAVLGRRVYFRWVPQRSIDARNRAALTFQGAS
ncbi:MULTISPECIES: FAD-dependent oxidoreductase [unclassified Solwaraspora]|uniref:FAD-dependent oxidoreductase n=1 Tax=unclassified Solwaraspora TaxID=2627926 RepID=UPI00259B5828|nr:NAD(P)/FAD-dependent oxidoreductase [Solwaraspora sp. WMMA2056]WJK39430.1 NAD(P)/FAD-dependent oxidoreductase [Solwaraspora sp. WMMA2056]